VWFEFSRYAGDTWTWRNTPWLSDAGNLNMGGHGSLRYNYYIP
jgi:hypothetical protein